MKKNYIFKGKTQSKLVAMIGMTIYLLFLSAVISIVCWLSLEQFNIVLFLLMSIILFLLHIPWFTFGKDYWIFDNDYIEIFHVTKYFDQIIYMVHSLLKKQNKKYSMHIGVNDMASIHIICRINMIWPYFNYSIYLGIQLKDQTLIKFNSKLSNQNREDMYHVLKEIEARGVQIIDQYHLMDVIGNPNINMYDYIIKKMKSKEAF